MDFVSGRAHRARCLFQTTGVVAHHHVGVPGEDWTGALKRAPRDHVHAAHQRGTGRFRRRRMKDFDAPNVAGHGELIQLHLPPGARRGRARHAEAVNRDRNIGRLHSTERNRARIPARIVDGHSWKEFQELSQAAFRNPSELVRGDHVDHLRGKALLVDRNRRSIHFPRGGHNKLIQLNRLADRSGILSHIRKREVPLHGLPWCDNHCFNQRKQPGSKRSNSNLSRWQVHEAIASRRVRKCFQRSALDRDADTFKEVSIARIQDASLNTSRRNLTRNAHGGEKRNGEGERDDGKQ